MVSLQDAVNTGPSVKGLFLSDGVSTDSLPLCEVAAWAQWPVPFTTVLYLGLNILAEFCVHTFP